MPGNTCIVCANTRTKDPSMFFRVPKEKTKRLRWLKTLELKDSDIGCHHCVCSRHFPGGDAHHTILSESGQEVLKSACI